MSGYKRIIKPVVTECELLGTTESPVLLLNDKAESGDYKWLLAHADDGVIWGRVEEGKIITAYDAVTDSDTKDNYCVELRAITLQKAWLFGPDAELFIWRSGANFSARVIRDTISDGDNIHCSECFDEPQLLWGTRSRRIGENFCLLEEGEQGIEQVVPMDFGDNVELLQAMQLSLIVRHYLCKEGFARVERARLLDLVKEGGSNA